MLTKFVSKVCVLLSSTVLQLGLQLCEKRTPLGPALTVCPRDVTALKKVK